MPASIRDAMIRMFDHTADVGFELEAPTLEVLFEEALRALLMTIFERPPEKGESEHSVQLAAPDLETLLVRWINELVFLVQRDGFVPIHSGARIEVSRGEDFSLEASLTGAPLDLEGNGWPGGDKERDVPRARREARRRGLAGSGDPGRLTRAVPHRGGRTD